MTFASLPMILYILPITLIAAALVPVQYQPDVLALGGLAVVWSSGGFPALILLMCSICSAWLMLRLQPKKTAAHHRRADVWLYAGIVIQALLLLLGRVMLNEMQLIPLLLCAIQGMECMSESANDRLHKPALRAYFCYQCDVTRLPAGPVLGYGEVLAARADRSVSPLRIGQGAAWCIRGLFQLVCMALPMYSLCNALKESGTRTAADAMLGVLSLYFCVYYGLKGTARIGQGIAEMLGIAYPDSFDSPILADSFTDFRRRFLGPLAVWTDRLLLPLNVVQDATGYFVRMAVVYVGLGFLFCKGGGGILWGAATAAVLTAEHRFEKHERLLPLQARRVLTAIGILLSFGLLFGGSLMNCISFYSALLGFGGIGLSMTSGYLIRANWLAFLICVIGLLPFQHLKMPVPKDKIPRFLRAAGRAAAELFMLLAAYSELLSRYLRNH